jgi:DNA modification methylase
MKSQEIIQEFLLKNNIEINVLNYIQLIDNVEVVTRLVDGKIINNIIVDSHNGFSESVKTIANKLSKKYNVFLGRKEKKIVKKILDYECYDELQKIIYFNNELNLKSLKNLIIDERNNNEFIITECKKEFLNKLNEAIKNDNKKRIVDYLNFLYSRLLFHNELSQRSVLDIYYSNEKELLKQFDKSYIEVFKTQCEKHIIKSAYADAVKLYNDLYIAELIEEGLEHSDVIALRLNQKLFDKFNSKDHFLSYVFECISKSYDELKNHRTMIFKIENILDEGVNIKWELYSYLTIYAENFKSYIESRTYYKPEDICLDFLEHKYDLNEVKESKLSLKNYYKKKNSFKELKEEIGSNLNKNEIDYFRKLHHGLQFIDCYILKRDKTFKNSREIDFIKNNNELLLVFSKNIIDDRKIPCPVCSSLKISGNSYPEVGVKSWECKNNLCSERSKTNRGKRYSMRSTEMQNAVGRGNEDNVIDRELISKWRKDIVNESSYETIHEMIVKYFSYHKGKVVFVNFDSKEVKLSKSILKSRHVKFSDIENIVSVDDFDHQKFENFYNGDMIQKFIYHSTCDYPKDEPFRYQNEEKYKVENEDCYRFLKRTPKNSIQHMVTSPPYYNAREYSQWKNLYNYLHDMYNICQVSFEALSPGGVFFYNIGDIFDNPNTVVKSKMGERRVALGAYLILLFKKAGFELLDNIIWDKGETQSNRHKNDGNFTPYYQKPANSYEHMFVFKKPGELRLTENPLLNNNINKFSPVIKINSKGENNFGHTAPYPVDLPRLSIMTFTKEGDVVFDPFLGSGTTVYTAINNNRIGLGTELDLEYFKLANKFIEKEINTLRLF